MQSENGGASPKKTREIYAREFRSYADAVGRLATRNPAGVSRELAEDVIAGQLRHLTGRAVPVGVMAGPWAQVVKDSTMVLDFSGSELEAARKIADEWADNEGHRNVNGKRVVVRMPDHDYLFIVRAAGAALVATHKPGAGAIPRTYPRVGPRS